MGAGRAETARARRGGAFPDRRGRLAPASPGCHLNLAVALHGQGHFDEAIACCRRALELDPKYSAAHTELGRSLYAKGQIDRAIASLHKAIELNPKNAWAHSGMGAILCDHKRDYDAAIACFRKALSSTQSPPCTTTTWAMRCGEKGDSTRRSPVFAAPLNSTRTLP